MILPGPSRTCELIRISGVPENFCPRDVGVLKLKELWWLLVRMVATEDGLCSIVVVVAVAAAAAAGVAVWLVDGDSDGDVRTLLRCLGGINLRVVSLSLSLSVSNATLVVSVRVVFFVSEACCSRSWYDGLVLGCTTSSLAFWIDEGLNWNAVLYCNSLW